MDVFINDIDATEQFRSHPACAGKKIDVQRTTNGCSNDVTTSSLYVAIAVVLFNLCYVTHSISKTNIDILSSSVRFKNDIIEHV
jgi:hypothetical protein